MKCIEISRLAKTFKMAKGPSVQAVKDVTLEIGKGEVFGFLGPNGAGKSTTIKMLMGLIHPTGGHASITGNDINSHRSRRIIGYLPENPAFYDFLSAKEFLLFTGRTFGLRDDMLRERTEQTLKLLGLWESRDRPMRGYSKGMVQRLGLAQTLIHDPDVYILDEPMSGLDPLGRALVKNIIMALRAKGKCVFFSTHITSDVETICDRVGVLLQGTLQCVENVGAIMEHGIVGYHLRVRTPGSSKHEEIEVSRAELQVTLGNIRAAGQEITLIEPKRKNLESFFLDIVKGSKR